MDFRTYSSPKRVTIDGQEVLRCCYEAKQWMHKCRGLLGSTHLTIDEGLLLYNCNSVHTFFMRYPIDLCFLDHMFCVMDCVSHVRPFRLSKWVFKASHTLEAASGWTAKHHITEGMRLTLEQS